MADNWMPSLANIIKEMRVKLRQERTQSGYPEGSANDALFIGRERGLTDVLCLISMDPMSDEKDP